jgi:lipopolysaccharide export LptBFGC system permease protein LptF
VTCGYLVVLVFSNFAHSERFHFPILAFELMFAAYGVSMLKNKHKRWYVIWLVFVCVANIAWAWIKLAGRGMV